MWHDIFYDQNDVFQWASIAAIISFLAFCSTSTSIYLSQRQGKKNRKSSTLATLRIEELKEVRKESGLIISTVNAFMELNRDDEGNIKSLDNSEFRGRLNEYINHTNALYSILYRDTPHAEKLLEKIGDFDLELMKIKNIYELGDWTQEFEFATVEYSRIEYKEIEKYI